MAAETNLVLEIRKSLNETQENFADRLGVGLRSLKRYEKEGILPRSEAVRRALFALAKKQDINF